MVLLLRKYLICAIGFCFFATPCAFGEEGKPRAGIGLFDTLYIAENATLTIHGDLYLAKARVLGEGDLVMKAEDNHRISAEQSAVNNLQIITNGIVTLEGQLAIGQSLTVQSGILDASKGTLGVLDSAAIRLQHGGRILQNTILASQPVHGGYHHTLEFSAKAILTSITQESNSFSQNKYQYYNGAQKIPLRIYRDAATVPPEQMKVMIVSI